MRFLALALFIVAAVSYCKANEMDELMPMDDLASAPYTQTALRRVQGGGLWGTKRANRTMDAIIVNKSAVSFRLKKMRCAMGMVSPDLLPDNQLPRGSSSVFGMQSSRDVRGMQCRIMYEGENGRSWMSMSMKLSNPWNGEPRVYARSSKDLRITPVVGKGNKNQVRFTVREKSGYKGGRKGAGRAFQE